MGRDRHSPRRAAGTATGPGWRRGDPPRRVRILATLATELNSDQTALRGQRYADEALEAARRLGRPDELTIAVSAYLWSAEFTDNLPKIRAVLDEMLRVRLPDLTPLGQVRLLGYQLEDRIRLGELGRFDTEFTQAWHLATDVLHSPEAQVAAALLSSMPLSRPRRPRARR